MLDKLGLPKSTYYRYAGGRSPRADRWADVRPLVREAFARTPNGMGYRQVAMALLALPQNQPNAPLYPAGGAPGSRPGALPHFGRPRYLGPPPRARSTAG